MKVAILFPSAHLSESWGHWLNDAFREKGHETYILDYRALNSQLSSIETQNRIFSRVVAFKPDMVLVIKGDGISIQVIDAWRKRGIFCITWQNDDPQLFQQLGRHVGPYYDYVLTSSEDCIHKYRILGTRSEYLPFFCHPPLHKYKKCEKDIDVSYIGTFYLDRIDLLKAVDRDFGLTIYGDQWPRDVFGRTIERIPYDKALDIWRRSKITLNISQPENRMGRTKVTLRPFEVMPLKTFVLSDYMLGMEDIFTPDVHLGAFNGYAELLEKIRFYLDNLQKREKIAKEGQKEVLRKHTSYHRVERIIEIYEETKR